MSWQDKFNDWELEKGRDYFEMNKVLFIDRDNNIFTAQVAGSDYYSEYKVTTVINNNNFLFISFRPQMYYTKLNFL